MKVLVLGCGLMGRAITLDLLEADDVEKVTVVDVSHERLKALQTEAQTQRLSTRRVDAANRSRLINLSKRFDVVTNALTHTYSVAADRALIKAKVPVVDLSFEDEHMKLDSEAKKSGVIVVPGCGVAPGMTNILVGDALDQLEQIENVEIMCGGLTPTPSSPLRWRYVFSLEAAWGLYMSNPRIVKQGQIVKVEPRSGLERVSFPDPFIDVEAFYTDGLASLMYTMKDRIPNMVEKTIRWAGNIERVSLLAECGFLSNEPVKIDHARISPRRFNSMVMRPLLELQDERDVTLLRVDAFGRKNGKKVKLRRQTVDYYDETKRVSSMGRTTGYPCSAVAMMIGRGEITTTGLVPPEILIRGRLFHEFEAQMNKRNIIFQTTLDEVKD
jgi:lysine 6-dehydrogenase